MNEDGKDPIGIVALDVPPGVVCTDGSCVIPGEHPAASEAGSDNSMPEQ